MKPQPRRAREGRVNPNGIPCLYLADTKETAMAEMRAWLGTPITVSQFELVRDISILDFSGSYVRVPDRIRFPELDDETLEIVVWGTVCGAFFEPVTDGDGHQLAQRAGDAKWYSAFELRVAKVERAYSFRIASPAQPEETTRSAR